MLKLPVGNTLDGPRSSVDLVKEVRRTPLWSRAWILGAILTLLAVEWFWRRWLGLA